MSAHVSSYDPAAPHPASGSVWVWEPAKPHAREVVTVVDVHWNGEEWWVQTAGDSGVHWNDLSRFVEACEPA